VEGNLCQSPGAECREPGSSASSRWLKKCRNDVYGYDTPNKVRWNGSNMRRLIPSSLIGTTSTFGFSGFDSLIGRRSTCTFASICRASSQTSFWHRFNTPLQCIRRHGRVEPWLDSNRHYTESGGVVLRDSTRGRLCMHVPTSSLAKSSDCQDTTRVFNIRALNYELNSRRKRRYLNNAGLSRSVTEEYIAINFAWKSR